MLKLSIEIRKWFLYTLILFFISLHSYSQKLGAESNYYYENLSLKQGFPSSQVYQLFEDDKGNKWFITDRGVAKYDGHAVKVYSTQDGLADLVNFTIIPEDKSKFWLESSKSRLSYWDGIQFNSFKFNHKVIAFFKDSGGRIKLLKVEKNHVIIGHDDKSYKVDRKSGEIQEFKFTFDKHALEISIRPSWIETWGDSDLKSIYNEIDIVKEKNYRIIGITQFSSNSNRYGIATTKGAHLINTKTKEHIVLFPQLQVNAIYEDKNRGLWITTYDKGVFYFPSQHVKRLVLESQNEKLNESCEKLIFLNENLLILSSDKYLFSVSPTMRVDKLQSRANYIYSNSIENNCISNPSWRIEQIDGKIKATKRKSSEQFYFLRNGDTVIINHNSLLVRNKRILFKQHIYNTKQELREDLDSSFWLGDKFGLYHIAKSKGKYHLNKIPISSKNKFIRINDIEIDKYGNVWVATLEKGVILIRDGKITSIKHPKLLSSAIHNLHIQDNNTLWIATNSGLNKLIYNPKIIDVITKVETYTEHDGLLSNFINDVIFWKGNLYLATDKGVCFFNPKKVHEYLEQPKLQINGMYINNTRTNIHGVKHIFKSNENDIRFIFNGVTKNVPQRNYHFYRYRLINSKNENWKFTNSPNATLSNLPFGEYIFEVQCQTINQVWSEPALSSFEIKPHISETWWFKTILVIGFILIISLIIYFKLENDHKRTKQLLMTKKSKLAVLTNQMNPHFIFNTMSAIESFVLSQKPLVACEYIGKFSMLMRLSIAYSRVEFISIRNEINFMEKYLELEKLRFGDNFSFEITNMLESNIEIPPLLVQPLVENSIKHAFKGIDKKGKLELSYSIQKGKHVCIRIKDNGTGFDTDKKPKSGSFGLNIIEERLRIFNIEAKRKDFTINIMSSTTQSIGTEVELKIPYQISK